MANFCTSCGSELNPEARFCTKCGASVGSESAVQQQGYTQAEQQSHTGSYTQPPEQSHTGSYTQPIEQSHTGSYTQPIEQSYTGSYTQPIGQSYTPQYTPPVKSGGGISGSTVICIVLAAVLFLQILVVLLLGWPGFAVRGGKDRLSEESSQISVEAKISSTMDLGSCKLIEGKAEAI